MRVIAELKLSEDGQHTISLPALPVWTGKKKPNKNFRNFIKRMARRNAKLLAEMSATPSHAGILPARENPPTSSKKEVRMVTRSTSIRQKVNHVAGAHRF